MQKKIVKFIETKFNLTPKISDKITQKGYKYVNVWFNENSNQTNCNIMIFSDKYVVIQYRTYKKGLPLAESVRCDSYLEVKKLLQKLLP